MSTSTIARNTRLAQAQKLSDGVGKHANVITTLVIDGHPYTAADIVAILQEIIASETSAATTHAQWRAAVAADKAERAKRKTFLSGLKQALRVAFGAQIDVLGDFVSDAIRYIAYEEGRDALIASFRGKGKPTPAEAAQLDAAWGLVAKKSA
jgi:hypothetical protein